VLLIAIGAAIADAENFDMLDPGRLSGSEGHNVSIDPNEVAKAGVPLDRAGQVQDIANAVLFLASDASNCMTGVELVIRRRFNGRRRGNSQELTGRGLAQQHFQSASLAESPIIIYLWKIPLKSHCSRAASR
jgi:hypothetical protein